MIMKKKGLPLFLSFFIVILIFFWTGISRATGPKVIATIFPLYDMAKGVAGNQADITLLIPPGANPHSWEPRPSDMVKIQKADLILMVGAGLEPWADKLWHNNRRSGGPLILQAAAGMHLIVAASDHHDYEHNGTHYRPDPHIWMDFSWDKIVVSRICKALVRINPHEAEVYKKGAREYMARLDQLITAYKNGLSRCRCRDLVVGGHGAFHYLARSFGLKQISLYGISPDARPTPRKMAEVVDLIKNNGIKTIFFEETVSDRLAKVLARETGTKILTLTPGASLTRKQIRKGVSFLDLMYENLDHLQKGLGCAAVRDVSVSLPPKGPGRP